MIVISLSLISGLLTGLSFNLPFFSFLIWFSLVPFIYAISKRCTKLSIFSGVVFSFAFYGSVLFWVTKVTGLGLIFLLFYLSFYCVIFSYFGYHLIRKPLRVVTLPCLWVVLEFLREIIWCGFGWASLGYSQYKNLYLIQLADLGGVKLISFLIIMVNVLITEIIFTGDSFSILSLKNQKTAFNGWLSYFFQLVRKINFVREIKNIIYRGKISGGLKRGISIILIFLICFLYSVYRLNNLEESGFLKVSVVQPNILQELKWKAYSSFEIFNVLSSLAKKSQEDTLVIFPEASWPLVVDQDNFYKLERFIRSLNRDIVIGAVIEEKGKFYNAALLFDREAKLIGTYRKIKLVPFGEYVPLREFVSFIDVLNFVGDMSRGEELTRFSFNDKNFSVLICFEDIFPGQVLKFSRNNDFLINITNDAWFKGEPQAGQHLGIMIFRAIENRISIIRSANTGISGWVSYEGKVDKIRSGVKEVMFSGIKSFRVALNEERSFYNKYGDVFSFLCGAFLLVIFIIKIVWLKMLKRG